MDVSQFHVDRREVLRYLGYRGGEVPEDVRRQIRECEALLLGTAHPRVLWKAFDLLPDGSLAGCTFRPEGESVRTLLKDCTKVILMAATMGTETEKLLQRTQQRDMAQAAILDAAASAAVEAVCETLCEELQRQFSPAFLTDLFSPGYGDFPLSQQAEMCAVLDVTRRIGIYLSESGMMIPQKSVTALIGVSDRPQEKRSRGCAVCPSAGNCQFCKEGTTCGDF